MTRLDTLRGPAEPLDHNARTIAALAVNPGCDRRALLDAAGVDKQRTATHLGFPAPFGQSPFAITRAKSFDALVKANGCAHLLRLLRSTLDLSISEASYSDISDVGGNDDHQVRHTRTRALLKRAATDGDGAGTLFDHPLLKLTVAGHEVYLEPAVIAFQIEGRFHIVEIKSFAVIDDQADAGQVAAAARQSAVYVHALRALFTAEGLDPGRISHNVVLVCPKDFANHPTATLLDVRQQLAALERQLSRLTRIDRILDELPIGITFDLETQSPDEVGKAVATVGARFAPECLASCEMSLFCRAEARDRESTDVLGRAARDELGGIESIPAVLGLADDSRPPSPEQLEIAEQLRYVRRIYTEAVA
ncbi:hypothetical protein GCM10023194_80500 [Planotetraspora phitsanulokensis]|uniref:Secreted protein n=1 Tax=Planotetraspora phitsanulokensis TaxID=575192 RepID=A0A8J3UBP7_9ACTN|nr:hypothetical protein [Planotetraspora phitsanulokensis]GII41621.1 hypothetical protein Pph01_66240 [Planotetraspora phitsanulokensis]